MLKKRKIIQSGANWMDEDISSPKDTKNAFVRLRRHFVDTNKYAKPHQNTKEMARRTRRG